MKLGRVSLPGPGGVAPRLVAVHPSEGRVVDLAGATGLWLQGRHAGADAARHLARAIFPESVRMAIASGDVFLEVAQEAEAACGDDASVAMDGLRWESAVDAGILRDAVNFPVHIEQSAARMGVAVPKQLLERPAYYKASAATLIGHDGEVPWPGYCEYMDFELELGFVVGRSGRDLNPGEAADCIFGVTIYNDFSARDAQIHEALGGGPIKSKDFATGVGPWITTIDEFGSLDRERLANLDAVARVNGEVWGIGDGRDPLWSPAEILAFVSQGDTLQPGDLIGSGTFGNGCGLELGRQLAPGDVVELEIDGVGVLKNSIGDRVATSWWPEPCKDPFSS